jgi:hypothetical protein
MKAPYRFHLAALACAIALAATCLAIAADHKPGDPKPPPPQRVRGMMATGLSYYEDPPLPDAHYARLEVRASVLGNEWFGVGSFSDALKCRDQIAITRDLQAPDNLVVLFVEKGKPYTLKGMFKSNGFPEWHECSTGLSFVPVADEYRIRFDSDEEGCSFDRPQSLEGDSFVGMPDDLFVGRKTRTAWSQHGPFCEALTEAEAARLVPPSEGPRVP